MQKGKYAVGLVSMVILVILCFAPAQFGTWSHSAGAPAHASYGSALSALAPVRQAAHPAPLVAFPRTVLVETFTGVWCIHCPAESQALHYLDLSSNESVLSVAELHVCAFPPGQGPCLENYVPADSTSDARGAFYNVGGFPDVFFDGNYPAYGASNSVSQMQGQYSRAIANASMIPGNVSISQNATVSPGNVTAHINVTSAITGSFNAVTYLTEYIDKQNLTNGYGPHDVDHVVRETLHNHAISLVAGSTTGIDVRGSLNSTWNTLNLSVITFVQQNSTRIVENANMAAVTTLTTAVTSNRSSLPSGAQASVTVRVANSSTGAPVSGATVAFSTSGGGSLTPTSGVTASDGTISVSVRAPIVASLTTLVITARVTAANYTSGSGSIAILVNPGVAPLVPTGLVIAPGNLLVSLNWTSPTSGGAGLTYHVFRSASIVGPYSEIGVSTTTNYSDSGVAGGHSYWYMVRAQNAYGFSANTSAVVATGITVGAQGLPADIGWWISVDSGNFSSPTNASVSLYLPVGTFSYKFGPASYAFVASGTPDPLTVTGLAFFVNITFLPRYASLHGTVSPSNAVVRIDGSLIKLVNGAFVQSLVAGTYVVNVTAFGYQSNSTTVELTAGNATPLNVKLQSLAWGSTAASDAGLTGADTFIVIAGVLAAVAVGVATVLLVRRAKRRKAPATWGDGPRSAPRTPRKGS